MKTAALTLAALMATSLAPAAPAPTTAPTQAPKTLVIGIDGSDLAKINDVNTPNLAKLADEGLTASSNLYAKPMSQTMSGPGWSTMATGVWPDKHNVVDNRFTTPRYGQYPDFLTRLEHEGASTAVIATWDKIPGTIFSSDVDTSITGKDDEATVAAALSTMKTQDPDAMFVAFNDVDAAGHRLGARSKKYSAAHALVDEKVGRLMQQVDARRARGEDWLVIVTTDHGHKMIGGHGGDSDRARATYVIANGRGIAAQVRRDVKLVDVAPTVLAHHQLAVDPAWRLDGTAIGDLAPDDFDAMYPKLKSAADEKGITAKGWTHSMPTGWSVDNSAMPAGGMSEWRGWSLSTDQFWTNTHHGQRRELSVHNRDVFAVADSDEWDDKSHASGPFDSTLLSPAYPVHPGTATVRFTTNYAVDGPQSGQVLISFDGGEPQLLKTFVREYTGMQELKVKVPAGAQHAQLRFRYTGENSAFWTVDQVSLSM